MKLISRLTRLKARELAGLALLFNLPFALLQVQRGAYDTYVHIFLADHYRQRWFNLWEPRWYLGFSTASYPPLIHQLIALISWPAEALVRLFSAYAEQYPGEWRFAGEEFGYVVVQLVVLAAFPLALRAFARIFVGPRTAKLAGLLAIGLPGLSLVVWGFGQLPSTAATLLVLAALSRGYAYMRHGQRRALGQAVGLAALVAATHHGVFLLVPLAGAAVAAQAALRLRRGQTRQMGWGGWLPPRSFWGRLLAWGGLSAAAAAAMLWPFLVWSRGQALQTPIDHLSRHNLLLDPVAAWFFFWPVYGPLLLVLPWLGWAAGRVRGGRAAPVVALTLCLFVLGLGGTTALPRLLYGAGWAWLTYERFAFWAAATMLPLTAALLVRVGRRRPWAAGLFFAGLAVTAGLAGAFSIIIQAQPPAVAMGPIVRFLDQPENRPYRYFTLGLGDQLARLATLASNGTPDGTYHTARQLPELRQSGIGALDTVLWATQAADAYPFLAQAQRYGARWTFVSHPYYVPVLQAAGWLYRFDLAGVQVWEKPDVQPVRIAAPPGLDRSPAAIWWGLAPLTALALTALALAAPGAGWAGWTRFELAQRVETGRLWGWGASVGLMTLWWHHRLASGTTPWVYFVYQDVLLFAAEGAAALTVGLWLVRRGLAGGRWRMGPRGIAIGLGGLGLAAALSLWSSASPTLTAAMVAHLGLLSVWYWMLVNDPPAPRVAGRVVVGVAALQGVLALAQALTQSTAWLARLGLPWPGAVTPEMSGVSVVQAADGRRWLRAYGTLSHPNILGGFLVPGVALALERLGAERRWWWLIAGGLVVAGLVLSFSRSAWLAAGVMVAVGLGGWLAQARSRAEWARLRRWAAAGAVGLALVSLPVLPMMAARVNLGSLTGALERRSLDDRVQLSGAAIRMLREQPVTGVGAGAFVVRLYEVMGVDLPLEPAHNLPLLLAAEMGGPGAAAMVVFGLAVGGRLVQRRRTATRPERLLGAALAGMLVIGLFDHYWWTMAPARLLLVTVLGLWVGYSVRSPASVR